MAVWLVEHWTQSSARQRCALMGIGVGFLILLLLIFRSPVQAPGEPGVAAVASAEKKKDANRLEKLCRDPDARVAAFSMPALARVDGARALPVIHSAASDPRPEMRTAAATAFAQLSDPIDVSVMNQLLAKDAAPQVRLAAAKALGKADQWAGLKQLVAALDDPDAAVRGAAIRSIEKIMGMRFDFDATAPRNKRQATMAKIRQLMPGTQRVVEAAKQYQRNGR